MIVQLLKLLLMAGWTAVLVSGCATYATQRVGPTTVQQAQEEIPESQLLDIAIVVFSSVELSAQQAEKEGTHPDARIAEQHYIPYHLKNTIQKTGHWGAVRVVPNEIEGHDLVLKGEVVKSNGERLTLKLDAVDATGRVWLRKVYKAKATEQAYLSTSIGEQDPFQDVYYAVANDLAAFKGKLSAAEMRYIRTTATLRFAADFAPHAFAGYLTQDHKGRFKINRLPADNDPNLRRLQQIRQRVYLYEDTLNAYYEGLYNDMWPSYENWRKAYLTEQTALRKVKRSAFAQQALGALLVALAIGLGVGDVGNTAVLQAGLVIAGGQVIINGINVSKQAAIHRTAIQELGDSFGAEIQPIVMDYGDRQYELTGSAQEQYKEWRELLRELYFTETGFPQPEPSQ